VSGSVVPALKVFGLLFGVAAVLVLMDPGILATLDPRWHPMKPHGKHSQKLVGVWVRLDGTSDSVLILKPDGLLERGYSWGYWHGDEKRVVLDSMSRCGVVNASVPGSRANSYQIAWMSQHSMELTNNDGDEESSIWERVDPNAADFRNSIRKSLVECTDEASFFRALSIEDALCRAGIWKHDEFFPKESRDEEAAQN
jgi:hypothetical protein